MNKKQLIVAWVVVSLFIISGCGLPFFNVTKNEHKKEASLAWYTYYWVGNDAKRDKLKAEYEKKIEHYLEAHPEISKEIADNMRNCTVTLGMTREQVLAMVKPHYILRGRRRNERVFKYSDIGKFAGGKFIGEGTKVWITFTDGVVTDISELNKFM